MTKESAALAEEENLEMDLGVEPEAEQPESATDETVTEEVEAKAEVETKPEDGFQKRINKVTADKYAEKRRADELQRKIDELEAKPKAAEVAPKLEDFDHDEEAFSAANVRHQVSLAMAEQDVRRNEEAAQASARAVQRGFEEQVVALGKEDFADKASAVPLLPAGVADALMQSEGGAQMIYHLGGHLDVADRIAGMTTAAAMMELGRISANMSATKDIKTSAAPDPIEPIKSGGVTATERGPNGAKFE